MAYLVKIKKDLNHLKNSQNSLSLDYDLEISSKSTITLNDFNIFNVIVESIKNNIVIKVANRSSNQHNVNIGDSNLIHKNIKFGYKLLLSKHLLDFLKNEPKNVEKFTTILRQDVYEIANIQKEQKFESDFLNDLVKYIRKEGQTNALLFLFKQKGADYDELIKEHIKNNLKDTTIFVNDHLLPLEKKIVVMEDKIKYVNCVSKDVFDKCTEKCQEHIKIISFGLAEKEIKNELKIKIKLFNLEPDTLLDLLDIHYNSNTKSTKFDMFYKLNIQNKNLTNFSKNELIKKNSLDEMDLQKIDLILNSEQKFTKVNQKLNIEIKI